MKNRSPLPVFLLLILNLICNAQSPDDRVLMTVAGKDVPSGEFLRMYRKSLDPATPQDVDTYLQQYISFKLKVADAIDKGLDTSKAYKNELNGYRNQLAQNYLTDPQAKETLIKNTYQRSTSEVNAWHILVNCPEGSQSGDSMIAWQKVSDIRERIINGENFEQVARATSDDPSVKFNGGNLGYFTVFQMIMPFEDAAYSLKKNQISEPVRTPYGYHIIKVTDKRPARGRVLVAHIMKMAPPGSGENELKQAGESINAIYKELQSGAKFNDLARKYSDHKESASTGGKLNWFGVGEMVSDFTEAAFAITDTGKYSAPVRTLYGWHIIKLLDKQAPGSFEETRSYLESKINQSYLNSISKKSFIEKLKKEYKFRINQVAHDWFVSNTDTLIIQGLAKYDKTSIPPGNIYSFANQTLTVRDFALYIERRGPMIITRDPVNFIDRSIETRLSDHILKYENSVLEQKYPEFRYLMNEFHDGILLFEISAEKVWNRVQEDSTGLKRYYDSNKQKYLTKKGIDAKLYILRDPNSGKKLASAYKKQRRKPDADRIILEKFNKKNDSILVIQEKIWFEGDDREIDKIQWKEGMQSFKINNYPSLIIIKKVIEPVPLPLDEVMGEMMSGYQDYLEQEWIGQLKEKYTVKIDNEALNEVKRRLANE